MRRLLFRLLLASGAVVLAGYIRADYLRFNAALEESLLQARREAAPPDIGSGEAQMPPIRIPISIDGRAICGGLSG